jgi:hypothetical protein
MFKLELESCLPSSSGSSSIPPLIAGSIMIGLLFHSLHFIPTFPNWGESELLEQIPHYSYRLTVGNPAHIPRGPNEEANN